MQTLSHELEEESLRRDAQIDRQVKALEAAAAEQARQHAEELKFKDQQIADLQVILMHLLLSWMSFPWHLCILQKQQSITSGSICTRKTSCCIVQLHGPPCSVAPSSRCLLSWSLCQRQLTALLADIHNMEMEYFAVCLPHVHQLLARTQKRPV